jgi:small subunit ribosomal protein S16
MVKIRLKRMGAKKKPFYRIVVADARSPRDGRFIEEIGYYDPLKKPVVISIDKEKALEWLKKGVQLSSTAKALFNKAGVLGNGAVAVAATQADDVVPAEVDLPEPEMPEAIEESVEEQ